MRHHGRICKKPLVDGTAAGDVLSWDGDSWEPVDITTLIITDIEIGTAAGQILFWDGSEWVHTETSELFWNDTTKRMGIGTLILQGIATGNIAIGDATTLDALDTDPVHNIAIGNGAGSGITDGDNNIFIGYRAGYSHTTSASCIAIGYEANYNGTIIGGITAVGYQAAKYLSGGNGNTLIGYQAGLGDFGGSVYVYNTFIGEAAGLRCNNGGRNVCLGKNSGGHLFDGDRNVFLGFDAGHTQTDNSNLLIIDNRERANVAAEITDCLIYGVFSETPASQSLRFNVGTTTWHNATHEDSDGGRASQLNFKGQQSGGEETTLARIEVGHDGTGDDQKGYLDISINDGNDGDSPTHVVTINSAGRFGAGTKSPNAPFEVKGLLPGYVGNFPSGLLHVRTGDTNEFANSVITGHNSYTTPGDEAGNTQLWYLGSVAGDNNNIAFINRQDAALSLWTNSTERLRIDSNGTLTLVGTARVIKHLQFTMELGRGQSAPSERFVENPYVSFTYAIGDDSHISREVPEDMDFTVASIVKIHWYTTDATANSQGDEVRWEVQWASRAPGEDLTAGDTTDNSGDIVCSAQNIIVETTVVTIPADSIVSGDILGLHIERVILGGGDGPTAGTVHALDVELEYTSNKQGKAT